MRPLTIPLIVLIITLMVLMGGAHAPSPSYRAAAERSNAHDAAKILNLLDRGFITVEGPARQQVIKRLETIRDR